ncbi:uncharacterized protein [Chironomus tepperi]|uniref:uncharacterized protein n=1 Tax=Chironomus tepperi TaxID=113505 RepID=UPI00391F0F33
MKVHFINAVCIASFLVSVTFAADEAKASNNGTIIDPFEADGDLRYAADTFCREYTLANPLAQKIVLPYKPDCHYWWQCATYQFEKKECQGANNRIKLHYDLYSDRCEMPDSVKCLYQFDEEEIIMEAIMEHYKKNEEK